MYVIVSICKKEKIVLCLGVVETREQGEKLIVGQDNPCHVLDINDPVMADSALRRWFRIHGITPDWATFILQNAYAELEQLKERL